MFTRKYIKQAKLLKKGVRKFLRYKQDILPDGASEDIEAKLSGFDEAIAGKEKESIKKKSIKKESIKEKE